jgi:hypothetical protein
MGLKAGDSAALNTNESATVQLWGKQAQFGLGSLP